MNIPPHRIKLAVLPTAIEPLPHLAAALGIKTMLVKRDDLTGLALGGNKTRKLEFILADALEQGAKTLITAGAVQSNHCRQTAAAAAHFNLDCILVLTGEKPATRSGNLFLDELFGAEIIWTDQASRDQVLEQTCVKAKEQGQHPYLIPYGGSNELGALAYADAMRELVIQLADPAYGLPTPDWIIFPSSSGGTQAGLVLGAHLTGYSGKIQGISIAEKAVDFKKKIAALASRASECIGERIRFVPEQILVDDNYLGEGYGVMGSREKDAISRFAQKAGLLLDPVYTGRAAAGMMDLIKKGIISSDQTVLFWHTGGTPALFADQYRNLLAI